MDKSHLKINSTGKLSTLPEFEANNQTEKTRSNFLTNSIVGLSIYLIMFFIWYYFKRNTILLEDKYFNLIFYYVISLFVASILSNKAFLTRKHEYMQSLRKIYISTFLALGIISIILLQADASTLSRYVIIGSILSGSVLESIFFYLVSENRSIKRIIGSNPVSYIYTIPDLILLTLTIYFFIISNIGIRNFNERHFLILVLIYISWNYSSLFTHRFNPLKHSLNNWSAVGLQLKFYLLIISSTALFVFSVDINSEQWLFYLRGVSVYSLVSLVIFLFMFVRKLPYPSDEVTNVFLKAFELGNPAISPKKSNYFRKLRLLNSEPQESIVKQKLKFQYFKDFPAVFRFLERQLELKSFDFKKTMVIRTVDIYNIKVLEKASTELFINLHEINDLIRINDYFRLLSERLVKDGIYVGCLIPLKNYYKRFQKRFPFIIASIVYFIDFIWRRVFPKLPVLREIYFSITRGKNRRISLAEGLGRLVYCGFEIISLTEVNGYIYFVSKKVKEPSTDRNPSYSPIFKMKRIGENGKQIFVYKLRTMHPYSEYLQEFVYLQNQLSPGGKFNYDFRISNWGRILRKLWIDELPMIINFFRRELKLVGVRPVSNHYLSLYSKEFQERRKKYKPGLVPPFYADMPKTILEIEQSEMKYFDHFDNSPFITDIKYFFKIFFNIIIHKSRSN